MILREAPIAEITEAIIDYRGKTPPKSASGIRLLTAKVIKDGTIDESRLEYISDDTYSSWMRRGFPRKRDILITTEAPLGETAILRDHERVALAQRVILLRGDARVVDQEYLFAAIRSPLMQSRFRQRATGTTVLGIKQSELRQVLVPLPPLPTQRKIAVIVSAYDDLIENNARRIKLLEEMAQRIYREWFTDLRYPGTGSVEVVESDVGQIPSDWEVVSLASRFSVVLGGTPSRKRPEYWANGTKPWINSSKVNDLRVIEPSEMITEAALRSSNASLMPRRTTVIAITGATLGQVSYLEIDASANQSVVGITDLTGTDSEWLFLAISANIDRLVGAASGGAQQHINKSVVADFRVALPGATVRGQFASLVRPMFDDVANLLRANRALRATRDLLLPRLISGEIAVDDLDIQVPEAA